MQDEAPRRRALPQRAQQDERQRLRAAAGQAPGGPQGQVSTSHTTPGVGKCPAGCGSLLGELSCPAAAAPAAAAPDEEGMGRVQGT